MASDVPRRRERITLDAFDPATGGTCEVQISYHRMQTVGRRSLGHAKEAAYIVPQILQRPVAVFEGLCDDDDEDQRGFGWRCYCGIPDKSFRADGRESVPYPGQVYLVFVNDESVAYNWRWERCDPVDATLPERQAMRFRKRLH